jgi:hypothetical protein
MEDRGLLVDIERAVQLKEEATARIKELNVEARAKQVLCRPSTLQIYIAPITSTSNWKF